MKSNEQIRQLYQHFLKASGVETDSRKIVKGSLFFALKGEHFDGNRFALQAIEKGAIMAVVSDPALKHEKKCFLVDDTLLTLQQLARHHRRQFKIPFFAITGSNGKTTTKELIAAVLSKVYITYATKGNLNNHIGVPLTLLSVGQDAEIAIIEMGANHIGEIDFLCRIAEPDYGLITNVGKAHLEGFGSLEGVIQAKGELFRYLETSGGTAFVNLRQPYLRDMSEGVHNVITYGGMGNQPYSVSPSSDHPFVSFEWSYPHQGYLKRLHIHSQLYGNYNLDNLRSAIAVSWFFMVPAEQVKAALEAYRPANNRSQMVKKGSNLFYLDAYNANPVSMRLALENFGDLKENHKVAILGDMLELGKESYNEHREILEIVSNLLTTDAPVKKAILVGKEFHALKASSSGAISFFMDTAELKSWFEKQDFHHHHFLVKGSRSIGLERLLDN